jgi:molybdopterin-guanine dinucleotide biosynthesis protein A
MQRDQVTALILAGGKATRMGGVDQRELVIAGRTIFERQVAAWAERVVGRLAAGRLKASSLLTDEPLRVRWVEEGELRVVDPHLRALHNVNAPEDMSP